MKDNNQYNHFVYKSCNNCGTVDIVPEDAQNKLGPIYTTEPFETRKCGGCEYYWIYKKYLTYAEFGIRAAEELKKESKKYDILKQW